MTQPKFKVGEEVILQSKECPFFNGEYVVEKVSIGPLIYRCRISGRLVNYSENKIGYHLNIPLAHKVHGAEIRWHECALKKKHPPANESFDQVMKSLKNGVKHD